jgi:hypothetical protein
MAQSVTPAPIPNGYEVRVGEGKPITEAVDWCNEPSRPGTYRIAMDEPVDGHSYRWTLTFSDQNAAFEAKTRWG